ncbi:MAG: hypothetical protein KatS3mg113_0072 [Planctomycetaceae bacterium]|nr:MAG: hypothetical protein KatS3mg113_0072 [Planctomycetaceae bacterium]
MRKTCWQPVCPLVAAAVISVIVSGCGGGNSSAPVAQQAVSQPAAPAGGMMPGAPGGHGMPAGGGMMPAAPGGHGGSAAPSTPTMGHGGGAPGMPTTPGMPGGHGGGVSSAMMPSMSPGAPGTAGVPGGHGGNPAMPHPAMMAHAGSTPMGVAGGHGQPSGQPTMPNPAAYASGPQSAHGMGSAAVQVGMPPGGPGGHGQGMPAGGPPRPPSGVGGHGQMAANAAPSQPIGPGGHGGVRAPQPVGPMPLAEPASGGLGNLSILNTPQQPMTSPPAGLAPPTAPSGSSADSAAMPNTADPTLMGSGIQPPAKPAGNTQGNLLGVLGSIFTGSKKGGGPGAPPEGMPQPQVGLPGLQAGGPPAGTLPGGPDVPQGEGGRPGGPAITAERGSMEYAVMKLFQMAQTGDFSGADEVISDKARGLADDIRLGKVNSSQLASLKTTFEKVEFINRRPSGGGVQLSFSGGGNKVIQVTVFKEGSVFRVRDLKIVDAPRRR